MAWKMKNPKTGEVYDVQEQYDEQSQTDIAREKAIAKGYIPVADVVNPKTGESFQIDDRELEKALAKGYQTKENAKVQSGVAQDQRKRQEDQMGTGMAMAKGFADTATYGFSDEIGGAWNAITGQGDYRESRDYQRGLSDTAQDKNTGAYYSGMAGAILPTLAATATKAPTLANAVKAGAVEGATFGAGGSEAELLDGDVKGLAKDVAIGASVGAAIPVAMKGAGKAVGKVSDVIGDTNIAKAFKGGADVRKFGDADAATDLANRLHEAVKGVYDDTYKASSEARRKFTQELGSTAVEGRGIVDDLAQFAGRHGDDGMSKLSPKQAESLAELTGRIQEPQNAQSLYGMWDELNRLKTEWEGSSLTANTSEYSKRLGVLMRGIKSKLHGMSDDLAKADAATSSALDKRNLLKMTDQNAESFLSSLGSRNKGNRRQAVYDMLAKKRPDLLAEIDNHQTYKAFQGQGGFGSDYGLRTGVGATVGYSVGGPAGAAVGGVLSSPRTQMQILTRSGDMVQRIQSKLPSMPMRYQQAFQDAARRGGNATAVTHFLLSNQDPEYRQLMDESED